LREDAQNRRSSKHRSVYVIDDLARRDEVLEHWLLAQPRQRFVTSRRGGEEHTRHTVFEYAEELSGPAHLHYTGLPLTVVKDPFAGPSLALIARYEYDVFGNVTAREVAAAALDGVSTRRETLTYDANGMFPESMTSADDHEVELSFDQALGALLVSRC